MKYLDLWWDGLGKEGNAHHLFSRIREKSRMRKLTGQEKDRKIAAWFLSRQNILEMWKINLLLIYNNGKLMGDRRTNTRIAFLPLFLSSTSFIPCGLLYPES